MIRRTNLLLGLSAAAFIAAACSSPGVTTAPTVAAPTVAATPAAASPAASPAASMAATTVVATEVGTAGTILVDGATGLTLYTFTEDVKDSGKSNCTAACLETWPALTVATGETPTGDAAVTGTLATITRADNGDLQVTYDGLPLYFFKNDAAPGDLNGVYDKWETVAP